MSMMLPEDMMAALGPAGGPQPMGGGGAMPPDMMAMLAGMGGEAPPEDAAPAGPSVVEGQPGGGEEPLIIAIDAIQEAIDNESDQEDIQVMLQCQTKLQGILAKNQADADAALGGQVKPKAARKMAGGLGGGGGY